MTKAERDAIRNMVSRVKPRECTGNSVYFTGNVIPYDYIAAACNAVPKLLDALDAAEAEIERLRSIINDHGVDCNS